VNLRYVRKIHCLSEASLNFSGMVLAISKGLEFLPPQPWFKTFIFLRVPFEIIKKAVAFQINEENDSFSKSICKPI